MKGGRDLDEVRKREQKNCEDREWEEEPDFGLVVSLVMLILVWGCILMLPLLQRFLGTFCTAVDDSEGKEEDERD